MRSGQIFLRFSVLLLLVYSCAPAYVPNKVNAPLLTNKGELQVSANFGTSGFDPQLAYAVTDNIALMANGSFMNTTSDTSSSSDFYHKHTFFELGPGYYRNLRNGFKFETFTGIGFGKVSSEYDNNLWSNKTEVNITRFFLQPSFGYTSKVLDIGISARLVFVNLVQSSINNAGILLEPVLTAKLGWDHIKITGQLGLAYPVNESKIHFPYQPGLFSLGLQGNFGKVFK